MKSGKAHRRKLQQPPSSFAGCTEEPPDENVGKDFRTLVDAPLSKGGHFVFKSEKTWSVDSSQYSEFFTLNLNTLSAAVDCIPFNEYIDVDDKYFTSDQLTSICNNAEKGKASYDVVWSESDRTALSNVTYSGDDTRGDAPTDQSRNLEAAANTKFQSKSNIDNLEEDIDFLLALKEPAQSNVTSIVEPVPVSHSNDSKEKPKDTPNKPIDLEKWLDSVLND